MAPRFRYTAGRRVVRLTGRPSRGGLLPLLAALWACGGASDEERGEDFARSTRADGGRAIALSSPLGTAQSGTVNFSAEGDSLLVAVELSGVGAGAHRGFIRHGQSCEAPGAAIIELPTVSGTPGAIAVAAQKVSLPDLPEQTAVVAYHEPNQTPGHVILCGLITSESMR
jgi:hypothetical protein